MHNSKPEYLLTGFVCPLLSSTEAEILQAVAEHLGVSALLSVVAAWQPPDAAAAQAASVSAGAEYSAQEGQGQTTQLGAEKSAATLPKVLLSTGTKHHYELHCTAAYCLCRKTQGAYAVWSGGFSSLTVGGVLKWWQKFFKFKT